MKGKLKNILENTYHTDIGIICIDNASSDYAEYQMKQRVKHTRLNLEYSGYVYTTLFGKIYVRDKVVNETATAFLVVDNKNDKMLREKLLQLSKYYKIPSFCWISANSHEIQTISVNDTSSDVVSVPFDFENSNELSFDINGVRLLLSLDLIVDIPRNYFNRTNYLGKLGIASGAKGKWERIVII